MKKKKTMTLYEITGLWDLGSLKSTGQDNTVSESRQCSHLRSANLFTSYNFLNVPSFEFLVGTE